MPPKRPPPPNFAALRHYAQISHAAAHPPPSKDLPPPPSPSPSPSPSTDTDYDTALTAAIQSLRRLILDQELSISALRQQLPPTSTTTTSSTTRLHHLISQRKAHDASFQTIDYIPPADSPLNHLLAHRSLTTVIARTTRSIAAVEAQIAALSAVQAHETTELSEQRQLLSALQARLSELEGEEQQQQQQQQQQQGGRGKGDTDAVQALVKRRREIAKQTAGILRELRWFLSDGGGGGGGGGLSRMLVAEEMGGPVVGDVLDVRTEGGFDKRGKSRKGERRIDEMWGQQDEQPEQRMAREFMEMLEQLMNASLEPDPYVPLKKDTAIVRFLVRAKVAVFHPKDARRLRLVDFASCVEDG